MAFVHEMKLNGIRYEGRKVGILAKIAPGYDDLIFDAVIISNSLHVMHESEQALKESRRVLKRGGVLVAPTFCLDEADDSKQKIR